MPEPDDPKNAAAITRRIEAAKSALNPKRPESGPASQAHLAWRMVVDLVAGIGIGAACGFGLDSLFGTTPVLLVVLTLLGFAAGVNLLLRTARSVAVEAVEAGEGKDGDSGSSRKVAPKEGNGG